MFAEFNVKVQTLMIDAADSSITKLFNMLSIDNILFSINITTTTVSVTTDANSVAMTTLLIIFKNKLIKSEMMRVYKD